MYISLSLYRTAPYTRTPHHIPQLSVRNIYTIQTCFLFYFYLQTMAEFSNIDKFATVISSKIDI